MEVELMEKVLSVNRSWIYDTYFSLYRAFHPGAKSGGWEMSGYQRYTLMICDAAHDKVYNGQNAVITTVTQTTCQDIKQNKHQ